MFVDLGFTNPWVISITGIIFFIIWLFTQSKVWYIFGVIGGIIGFPLLLVLILKVLFEKKKKRLITHLNQFQPSIRSFKLNVCSHIRRHFSF